MEDLTFPENNNKTNLNQPFFLADGRENIRCAQCKKRKLFVTVVCFIMWPRTIHNSNLCGPGDRWMEPDSLLDLQVHVEEDQESFLKASSVTLASSSSIFEQMLLENPQGTLRLVDGPIARSRYLGHLLDYLHGRPVAIQDMEHFIALMETCELANALPLKEELERLLMEEFSPSEILSMLRHLPPESISCLLDYGVSYVAQRFSKVDRSHPLELTNLQPKVLLKILCHDKLDVEDEMKAWGWVRKWIRDKGGISAGESCNGFISAVRFGLMPREYFDERVRTEPFVAIKEFQRCPQWKTALSLQRGKFRNTISSLGNSLYKLAKPRVPSECLLIFNMTSQNKLTKTFQLMFLDPFASKFHCIATIPLESSMKIEAVISSPFSPTEVVFLLKSWRYHQVYRTFTLNTQTQKLTDLPSFPSKGEKSLGLHNGELLLFTSRPRQRMDVLDRELKMWKNLYESEVDDSLFGSTAISANNIFYIVGGVRAAGQWFDINTSAVWTLDGKKKGLKHMGNLLTRRMNASGCQWKNGFVIAGGMWPDFNFGVPIEYFDAGKRVGHTLAEIPIPHGRFFHISQCQGGLLVVVEYPVRGKNQIFQYCKDKNVWHPFKVIQEKSLRVKGMTHLELQEISTYKPFSSMKTHLQWHTDTKSSRKKRKSRFPVHVGTPSTAVFWFSAVVIAFRTINGFL